MNRGHHIHAARLKAENEQLRAAYQPPSQEPVPPGEDVASLKLKIRQLELENKEQDAQIQRLIKLANLH